MITPKGKRVYTHHLSANIETTTAATVEGKGMASFVAEEDVLLIGWVFEACHPQMNQNDGESIMDVALVENAVSLIDRIDGVLEVWNTAPPFGQVQHASHVVMFPEGYGIHLSEGESIAMNLKLQGKSAGTCYGEAGGALFYVRE